MRGERRGRGGGGGGRGHEPVTCSSTKPTFKDSCDFYCSSDHFNIARIINCGVIATNGSTIVLGCNALSIRHTKES